MKRTTKESYDGPQCPVCSTVGEGTIDVFEKEFICPKCGEKCNLDLTIQYVTSHPYETSQERIARYQKELEIIRQRLRSEGVELEP